MTEIPAGLEDLRNQHVLVTGGNRGIGLAVVRAAAGRGARVSFLGRDSSAIQELDTDLRKTGFDVRGFCSDVTDEAGVQAAIEKAESHFGGIDVLVNNAGQSKVQGPLMETPISEWWAEVSVNLLGVATCAAAVLPSMSHRRSGRIINMVSGTAGRPTPYNNSAYACSKAAVVRLTGSLAEEVRGDGIKIFALRPGNVRTRMTAEFAASPTAQR